jgi:bacteriorhodopsin
MVNHNDVQNMDCVLWAVFGIMIGSSIVFAILMARQPSHRRLYHYVTLFITLTSGLAYFAMANGLGITEIENPPRGDGEEPTYRNFYYARYVDLAITTPLVLLDLCLLSGVDFVTIILLVVADVYMIIASLVGTLAGPSHNTARWGFFTTACAIFVYQAFTLLTHGITSAKTHSPRVYHLYLALTTYTLVLWLAYPVIWSLSQATNILDESGEILACAVVDILSKSVFGFWILFKHDHVRLIPIHHGREQNGHSNEHQRLHNPESGYGSTRH